MASRLNRRGTVAREALDETVLPAYYDDIADVLDNHATGIEGGVGGGGGGWTVGGSISSTTNQVQVGTGITSFRKMQISGATASDEEMLWIQDTATNHVGTIANQAICLVLRQMGTSNATATVATATGADIAVTQTRSAGANALTNTAILANASGGQVNYSWYSSNGEMVQTGDAHFGNADFSGNVIVTGTLNAGATTVGGNLTATALATLGTAGAGSTHVVNGNIHLRSTNADTYLEIRNNSTGGRDWFIEASGNAGTDPNCLAIYDNTAGLTRFRVTSTGQVEVLAGLKVTGNWALNGGTPSATASVTGSRGGNAALADLLTKLAAKGVIIDGTSA